MHSDKIDNFDISFVKFPFMCSDITCIRVIRYKDFMLSQTFIDIEVLSYDRKTERLASVPQRFGGGLFVLIKPQEVST